MPEQGLFSGLKFTDILFPALAAGASAYNPHIGRGLTTGMNLFNSMASFQNDARKWKAAKEEADLLKENLQQGHEAVRNYVGQKQQRADEYRRRISDQMREELDFPQGPGGVAIASVKEPLSEEDFAKGLQSALQPDTDQNWSMGVRPQDQKDLYGDQGAVLQERLDASPPPKFSEAAPWYLEQKVDSKLFDDPEYRALQQEIALGEMMGGTMALAPGAATSVLGYSALGTQDLDQERVRMLEAIKAQEGYAQNRFIEDQILKRQETEEVGKRAQSYAELDKQKKENWVAASDQVSKFNEQNINQLSLKDRMTLKFRAEALLQQAEMFGGAADPMRIADLKATIAYLDSLGTGTTATVPTSPAGGGNPVAVKWGFND